MSIGYSTNFFSTEIIEGTLKKALHISNIHIKNIIPSHTRLRFRVLQKIHLDLITFHDHIFWFFCSSENSFRLNNFYKMLALDIMSILRIES